MNYIVLDLEWNQPSVISQNIEGLPFEIIEIGAYKLNENLEKIDSFHRIIKPKYYKRLNYHISQVVMITEQELDLGLDFEKAGQDFVDWCGKDFYFCVWGVSDVYTLRSNLGHYNIKHHLKLCENPLILKYSIYQSHLLEYIFAISHKN